MEFNKGLIIIIIGILMIVIPLIIVEIVANKEIETTDCYDRNSKKIIGLECETNSYYLNGHKINYLMTIPIFSIIILGIGTIEYIKNKMRIK